MSEQWQVFSKEPSGYMLVETAELSPDRLLGVLAWGTASWTLRSLSPRGEAHRRTPGEIFSPGSWWEIGSWPLCFLSSFLSKNLRYPILDSLMFK